MTVDRTMLGEIVRLNGLLNNDLVTHVKGERHEIADICYNSKDCTKKSMFVAMKGAKVNGANYINEAIASGANTIVFNGNRNFDVPKGVTKVKVKDTKKFLALVSSKFFKEPTKELTLVGITGTSGKTTIAYMLESIFKHAKLSPAVIGTVANRFNGVKLYKNMLNTPESRDLQKISRDVLNLGAKSLVMEVSSHGLTQERVSFSHFDAAIFTNLSHEHLDYHKDMEEYFNAKLSFFTKIMPQSFKTKKFAVINLDDSYSERIASPISYPKYFYSLSKEASFARVRNSNLTINGIKATIEIEKDSIDINSDLIGAHNLENILATVVTAKVLGIDVKYIKKGINVLRNIPGRLERVPNKKGINCFIDYAHKERAMDVVLKTLAKFKKARLINVFGCGGNRDKGKRPKMGEISSKFANLTILTDDNPRHEEPDKIIQEIEKGIAVKKLNSKEVDTDSFNKENLYTVIQGRKEAIKVALSLAKKDDIVVICGKGHEDYQLVKDKKIHFSDKEEVEKLLNESA